MQPSAHRRGETLADEIARPGVRGWQHQQAPRRELPRACGLKDRVHQARGCCAYAGVRRVGEQRGEQQGEERARCYGRAEIGEHRHLRGGEHTKGRNRGEIGDHEGCQRERHGSVLRVLAVAVEEQCVV